MVTCHPLLPSLSSLGQKRHVPEDRDISLWEMRGQEGRGQEGGRKQAAVPAGRCKRGEEGGKTAQMMEEEGYSCMSSGFALQQGARLPALPWGCHWDWEDPVTIRPRGLQPAESSDRHTIRSAFLFHPYFIWNGQYFVAI